MDSGRIRFRPAQLALFRKGTRWDREELLYFKGSISLRFLCFSEELQRIARLWFVVNVSYCVTVLNKQGSRPPRRALHLHTNKHINSEAHSDESATMTDLVTSTKTEWLDDKNNIAARESLPCPKRLFWTCRMTWQTKLSVTIIEWPWIQKEGSFVLICFDYERYTSVRLYHGKPDQRNVMKSFFLAFYSFWNATEAIFWDIIKQIALMVFCLL